VAEIHNRVPVIRPPEDHTRFFAPEAHKGRFVASHNDPGVRAADEGGRSKKFLCLGIDLGIFSLRSRLVFLGPACAQNLVRPKNLIEKLLNSPRAYGQ
jgi:hypothetical protein